MQLVTLSRVLFSLHTPQRAPCHLAHLHRSGSLLRHLVGNAQGVLAAWFSPTHNANATLADLQLLTVCSRQALMWDTQHSSKQAVADFVCDENEIFHNRTMANRYFVGHNCLAMFDPILNAAIYDMRFYEKHPGDSYLFRQGTNLLFSGRAQLPVLCYTPPNTTMHMLQNESGGVRAIDFSSDGHLLVSGNVRGELLVWDVEHRRLMHKWPAHKRSAITCVKFSHDAATVYSCGEDCKVSPPWGCTPIGGATRAPGCWRAHTRWRCCTSRVGAGHHLEVAESDAAGAAGGPPGARVQRGHVAGRRHHGLGRQGWHGHRVGHRGAVAQADRGRAQRRGAVVLHLPRRHKGAGRSPRGNACSAARGVALLRWLSERRERCLRLRVRAARRWRAAAWTSTWS